MSDSLSVEQIRDVLIASYLYLNRKRRRRHRSVGVREIFRRRIAQGDGHNLLSELKISDPGLFFNYTRLNCERFEYLLRLVGPALQKREMYTTITPQQRLAMTLRFLAAGDSQTSLSFAYRCGQSTVSNILAETTRVLVKALKPLYMKPPDSAEEWKKIAAGFWEQWQFPHCLGAVDGKHVHIQAPQASQSVFFNYKKTFSMVLLAVCDANYCFIITDIGAEGSQSDGGIFNSSELGMRLAKNSLSIPPPSFLPGTTVPMPFFLVGDAAFPLKAYLMKPYGGRNVRNKELVFNYRISRARRVVESAFGILVARWRVFRQPIISTPASVESIIDCATCLHNFIKKTGDQVLLQEYCPPNFIDSELPNGDIVEGEWRSIVSGEPGALVQGPRLGARNATREVMLQREKLKEFLNGPAAQPEQEEIVRFRLGLVENISYESEDD